MEKIGIKSETFVLQMGIGSFGMGEILSMPNEVELLVISEPTLTFWDKVKRFFCMDYAYKYEVKILPPRPRTFLEETGIRLAHKFIQTKNIFESFGEREKEISDKLQQGTGIVDLIKQASEKVEINPTTEYKKGIVDQRVDDAVANPKKRKAKRRKN